MIKFTILFRKPEDEAAFEHFYNTQLAIMERIPDVRRREVGIVFGSPGGETPYYRMLEIYFDDMDTMDAALRSDAGQQAGKHLMQYAALLSDLFFCEVYEEEGGATPGALPTTDDQASTETPESASDDTLDASPETEETGDSDSEPM